MINKRMKELLDELNLNEDAVFTMDEEKLIEKVYEKVNVQRDEKIIPIRKKRIGLLPVACVMILALMAITTVAFNSGGFLAKIFPIFDEKGTEAELFEDEIIEDVVPEDVAPLSYRNDDEAIEEVTETEELIEEETFVEEEETEKETEKETNPPQEFVPDVADKNFHNSREEAEEYVQKLDAIVEDDNYIFCVFEAMGDSYNVYIEVSVTGKNEEAISTLMNGSFLFDAQMQIDKGWKSMGGGIYEDKEARTNDTRFFSLEYSNDVRGNSNMARIGLTLMNLKNEENYIEFEVSSEIERKIEFPLQGQDFKGGYLTLTELGINLDMRLDKAVTTERFIRPEMYIIFKNGEEKSFEELFGGKLSLTMRPIDDNYVWANFVGGTSVVLDLDEIKSIIVNNVEYDAMAPTNFTVLEEKASEVVKTNVLILTSSEETFAQITYPVYLVDVLDAIGVTDRTFFIGAMEFTLYDARYRVEADNSQIMVDGEARYYLGEIPVTDDVGMIVVGKEFLTKVLGLPINLSEGGVYLVIK